MKKNLLFIALVVSVSVISACAKNVSPDTYASSAVGVANRVSYGVVVSKRAVKLDASSNVGGMAGAVAGAAGGSAIGGSGRSNLVGAVGGAVLGGVLGNAADKSMNSRPGFEYIIKLKDGSIISIAQESDVQLAVKQRVLIIHGDMMRIVPDDTVDVK